MSDETASSASGRSCGHGRSASSPSEPPTDAELEALTEVARWTGSSRNGQPWRFIVIRDRAAIKGIHDAGVPQTRSLLTAQAAIAIVLGGDEGDVENAFDEGRAAERILVAAGLLGLAAADRLDQSGGEGRGGSHPRAAR